MSDYSDESAEPPVDTTSADTAPEITDESDSPVDLADADSVPDSAEIAEAPPAEDLSEPADDHDNFAEAPPESDESVDLGTEPDPVDPEPAVDDATDAAREPTIDELTEAARDQAVPTEELRAQNDADMAYLLAGDAPSDAGSTESPDESGSATDCDEASDAAEDRNESDGPADLGNSPDNEALTSALAGKGLSLESVDRFDYSDNPVLGYRESAPPEDVAYAVNAWNDQIAPGIAAGQTRDDFAAYDREHGLDGQRQLAGVYDYMLGDDAIKSGGQRENGMLDVTGGRHRLDQARQNGVRYLPVRK